MAHSETRPPNAQETPVPVGVEVPSQQALCRRAHRLRSRAMLRMLKSQRSEMLMRALRPRKAKAKIFSTETT